MRAQVHECDINHFVLNAHLSVMTRWPVDLGISPEETAPFLQLHAAVVAATKKATGPAVLHCPTGSGASAVFVLVNAALERFVRHHSFAFVSTI